jgi:hypothetical protein
MSDTHEPTANPIDTIPDPAIVRERLEHAIQETTLLRQLLRLSERAAKQRSDHAQEAERCS